MRLFVSPGSGAESGRSNQEDGTRFVLKGSRVVTIEFYGGCREGKVILQAAVTQPGAVTGDADALSDLSPHHASTASFLSSCYSGGGAVDCLSRRHAAACESSNTPAGILKLHL
jgi:hypothetical protein